MGTLLNKLYLIFQTGNYEQGEEVYSSTLKEGDIIGWKPLEDEPRGHVSVYVGNKCCDCKYVESQFNVTTRGGDSKCRNHEYRRTIYHMGY